MGQSSCRIRAARQGIVAERCRVAKRALDRMVGLLTRTRLDEDEALLIEPCKQVHTLFMRFPIDAVFLAKDGRVLGIENLKPWRVSGFYWKASAVLEIPAGRAARLDLAPGDRLEREPCSS